MNDAREVNVRSVFMPSLVWLFPLLTVVGLGLLYYKQKMKWGEEVRITFKTALNVEPIKTKLIYRGVVVGKVEYISMDEALELVQLNARLLAPYSGLAREGTEFILVQPKVGFQGIEGLETLISGPYIKVEPGKGGRQTEFVGQPVKGAAMLGDDSTVSYTLFTPRSESLNVKDPVTFRDVKIGEISRIDFDRYGQSVVVEVKIQTRYVTFVRENSVFWISSGISADFSLLGSTVDIPSLQSLVTGGIKLGTPEPAAAVAKAGAKFGLAKAPPVGWENWNAELMIND